MTRRPSFFKRFFRGLWRGITYLRLALSNLLFLVVLGLIYLLFSSTSPAPLPAKAALLLDPAGTVVDEKTRVEPLALLSEPSPATAETRLQDMIEAVDAAARDERISALVIATENLVQLGLSRAQELAPALARFRETGKPVIAAGDYFTQDQYLLAAEADEILLHPYGGVALEGFASYQNYFREALEKLAVDVHVFRAGEFKSIAEPLTRNDMSDGEKRITRAWLDDLWSQYTRRIETRRGLDSGALQRQIDAYPQRLAGADGDPARLALAEGLVDHLMSHGEMDEHIAARVGAVNDAGLAEMIPFQRYLAKRSDAPNAGRRIAVITAQGNILPGAQDPGAIGAESLSSQLRTVAASRDIAAIVLRINSGGGSVFASEVIRAALAEVRAGGVPVVVSMGPVAASGAYFIATAADAIWATPATLTGSIGVFAAFPTVDRLLSRAGI
ncbi:MAG: signal peptide peptidase SppA, partial [Chromatocurvus sp.]